MFQYSVNVTLSIRFAGDIMDAAFAVFKKTAIVLSLALLAAMPRLAQALTPNFTSPANGTVYTLSNGTASVTVTGSGDANDPPAYITFTVEVQYQSGDRPWLDVGSDPTASSAGGFLCNGGYGSDWTYTTNVTPLALNMGVGCDAGALSLGLHTATVTLLPQTPSGVNSVTFSVQYNTGGNGGGTLVPTPSSLTGTNAMTAPVGASVSTTVSLSTTSSSTIPFTTSTGAGWLSVQSATNQVTNTVPASLTIIASAAGLSAAASPYNSTVTVSYGSSQPLVINVTFNVTANGVSFSPSALAWTYSNSALSPAGAQSVSLTTPNTDTYTAAVSYPSGATATTWLQVNNGGSASGLTNGGTFSVSVVNYTTLAVGTYTGTITVTDASNSAISASLTVTLTVSGSTSGGVTISPNPISLNSTNSYDQLVTVTSVAGGAFTATPSSNWLGVTLSQSSIVAGGTAYMTVSANTSLSGSGTFTGSITVQVGSVSQQVTVNLTAGSGAGGTASGYVAPTTLNFVAQSGGTDVTQQIVFAGSGTFTVFNSPIYSTNSGSVAWLNTSLVGGDMSAQGTPVTIYANPKNLTPGTYTASLELGIVANGAVVQNPPVLQVNFVVTSGEVLSANPTTVILNSGGTSQNATITVTSSGGTALPVNVATDQTWLSATVQGGVTTTPATISVTANSSALNNGLYAGNVTVTGGSEQPLYVPVILVVSGAINPTGLTLSAPSMTFAAQVGGSAPPAQTLTVSSSPPGTVFTAAVSVSSPPGGTWLSIAPTGNLSTNQGLTVSVNQAGLAAGSYSGDIGLTANGASLTVPVNLVVNTTGTSGGNVTVSASTLDFSAVSGGAAPATQTLTVSSAAGSAGVPFTVTTSSTGSWLSVSPTSGTTQTNLTVSVNQTNLSAGNHSGSITITPTGGSAVVVQVTLDVVTQPAVSVSPASLSFAFEAGSGGTVAPGQLTVSATGGTASFQASASSSGNWLSVTPASGSTSTSTTLTVQVNPAGLAASATPYTGTITIVGVSGTEGSLTVDVSLSVTAPLPTISAVLNAASYSSGPVSPGEIVSIFGTSIGPTNPSFLTLNSAGQVSTSIGGVTVSFSGYPAPLTYVSATQINAIVPYAFSGNKEPFAEVKFAGQTSNDMGLQLAASAPGIFTQNSSGTGPGAILNGDSSLNTQANPAAPGSTIQIFLTGEGLTSPAEATGAVTTVNLTGVGPLTPAPQLAVSVLIGNQPAQTTFVGEAPGLVAGVLQVDAVVPLTTGAGAIPITVQVGKQISQSGVTVWVQ
jgi:uncharacterized protein (TIGR03437 family)